MYKKKRACIRLKPVDRVARAAFRACGVERKPFFRADEIRDLWVSRCDQAWLIGSSARYAIRASRLTASAKFWLERPGDRDGRKAPKRRAGVRRKRPLC